MYVHAHVHMDADTLHMHTHTQMWRCQASSSLPLTLFYEAESLNGTEFISIITSLASSLQQFPCLYHPRLRLQVGHSAHAASTWVQI